MDLRLAQLPNAAGPPGCRAIRVWVYGDGGGQQLKIQLGDNRNGYRDDYIPIGFTGWKQ